MLCIHEQIGFHLKVHHSLKQYKSSQTLKYCYKVFIFRSNKDVIHNFELHSEKILSPDETFDSGTTSNIELNLAKIRGTQRKLFAVFL